MKGTVVLYDTNNEAAEADWVQVAGVDHKFVGKCIVQNASLRLSIGTDSNSTSDYRGKMYLNVYQSYNKTPSWSSDIAYWFDGYESVKGSIQLVEVNDFMVKLELTLIPDDNMLALKLLLTLYAGSKYVSVIPQPIFKIDSDDTEYLDLIMDGGGTRWSFTPVAQEAGYDRGRYSANTGVAMGDSRTTDGDLAAIWMPLEGWVAAIPNDIDKQWFCGVSVNKTIGISDDRVVMKRFISAAYTTWNYHQVRLPYTFNSGNFVFPYKIGLMAGAVGWEETQVASDWNDIWTWGEIENIARNDISGWDEIEDASRSGGSYERGIGSPEDIYAQVDAPHVPTDGLYAIIVGYVGGVSTGIINAYYGRMATTADRAAKYLVGIIDPYAADFATNYNAWVGNVWLYRVDHLHTDTNKLYLYLEGANKDITGGNRELRLDYVLFFPISNGFDFPADIARQAMTDLKITHEVLPANVL